MSNETLYVTTDNEYYSNNKDRIVLFCNMQSLDMSQYKRVTFIRCELIHIHITEKYVKGVQIYIAYSNIKDLQVDITCDRIHIFNSAVVNVYIPHKAYLNLDVSECGFIKASEEMSLSMYNSHIGKLESKLVGLKSYISSSINIHIYYDVDLYDQRNVLSVGKYNNVTDVASNHVLYNWHSGGECTTLTGDIIINEFHSYLSFETTELERYSKVIVKNNKDTYAIDFIKKLVPLIV